jgi:hypothetical protein
MQPVVGIDPAGSVLLRVEFVVSEDLVVLGAHPAPFEDHTTDLADRTNWFPIKTL